MKTLALLLLATGTVLGAEPEVRRKASEEFYPTAVGTRWVMVSDYEDGSESYVDDIRVVEEKTVNGYRKWKVRTVSRPREKNPLAAIAKAFVPADDAEVFEGWEFYDVGREAYVSTDLTEGFEDDPPYPLVYYPAKVQDRFEDDEGVITTVVAVDRKVKVPAGEFQCIVYEIDYSGEGGTEVADVDLGRVFADPRRFDGMPTTIRISETAVFDEDSPSEETEEAAPDAGEGVADSTISVEYWAKGVGLVMTEEFDVEDDGSRTLNSRSRLVSFTVPRRDAGKADNDSEKD